jgi:hypothetical protein
LSRQARREFARPLREDRVFGRNLARLHAQGCCHLEQFLE